MSASSNQRRQSPTPAASPADTDEDGRPVIYTIGHSTHPGEYFMALLATHQIKALADVRSFPGSRRWPQFNREALASALPRAAVQYFWLKRLGGRRHSSADNSPHTAWTQPAFRSYADYADGQEFAEGLSELKSIACRLPTAAMCSEGLWWRCHRRIIADYLVVAGWKVIHIMPGGELTAHALPPFATSAGTRLIYNGDG